MSIENVNPFKSMDLQTLNICLQTEAIQTNGTTMLLTILVQVHSNHQLYSVCIDSTVVTVRFDTYAQLRFDRIDSC